MAIEIEELKEQIRRENKAYRAGKPIVPDEVYDLHIAELGEQISEDELEEFLETLMEEAGDVGFGDYVIGSLKKLKYENQELLFWLAKMQIVEWVFASAKIDGCSFVGKYKFVGNGIAKFSSCSSRGDGAAGTDWTEKARYILPAEIKADCDVDIRGEFTLTGDSHKQLGFKNRRNGTVGIMNSSDVDVAKLKHVKGFAYQILNPKPGRESIYDQFNDLIKMGVDVAMFISLGITDDIEEELKLHYQSWKDCLPYDIDGLVLSSPKWTNENSSFYPTGKIAYKVNSEGVPVRIIGVRWNLTQGRLYFPTYLLEPTEIDGVTVSKATANNTKMMMKLGIGTGSEALCIRSGCVIPKIIGVVKTAPYKFPTHCPECGSEFVWNKVLDPKTKELVDGVHLMCPNVKCGEVKRVEKFVKALEIENVSEKRLREWDILSFEDLLAFRPDSKAKLQVAFYKDMFDKLFNQPQHVLLRAMKFDGFGTSLFDKLFDHCNRCLIEMNNMFNAEYHIDGILPEGIGKRTIEKAQDDWNRNTQILTMIKNDLRYEEPEEVAPSAPGEAKLDGKTFLFTGSFSKFERKVLEKMVPANGGKLSSSVSKNLQYLVVGVGGGSKQEKAEKLGTVQIIDETTFLGMLA